MRHASGVTVALLLALGFVASTLPAQGPPPGGRGGFGPPQGRGRGGPPPADEVRAAQQALALTDSQMARFHVLLDTRTRAEQAAQNDVQAKTDALAAVEGQQSPSVSAIDDATQALQRANQSVQAANDTFRAGFLAMLTDDQKKTLTAIEVAAANAATLARLGVIDDAGRGRGQGPGGGRGGPPGGGPGRGGPGGPGRGAGPGRGNPAAGVVPASNPITSEKVALGKQLFFDKSLSSDGTVSCASCHNPERAFSDGRAVATGVNGTEGTRNAPTLINAIAGQSFFWDGRILTLEAQALQPLYNPNEMGTTQAELEQKTGRSATEVSEAIATYVRTIRSSGSRYDAYLAGQTNALNGLEIAGLNIFRGKGNCVSCHAGPNLTDGQFHNTGAGTKDGRVVDEGRYEVTHNDRDRGAFKTPTLREIALTAPYMHDGSQATLEDVVSFYSDGGKRNPNLDPRVRPLHLSTGEKAALVAFLQTLSGQVTAGQ